jgi:hypothetical protein
LGYHGLQGVWAGSSENEIISIEDVCGMHSFAILASQGDTSKALKIIDKKCEKEGAERATLFDSFGWFDGFSLDYSIYKGVCVTII